MPHPLDRVEDVLALRGVVAGAGDELGDVDALVAHPLDAADDVQQRGDDPQIAGHRRLPGEKREDALVDLEVAPVDPVVVGHDHADQLNMLVADRLEGAVELPAPPPTAQLRQYVASHAGVASGGAELLLDPDQLVVLGDPLGSRRDTGLVLPDARRDDEVGDERVLGLTRPVGDDRPVACVASDLDQGNGAAYARASRSLRRCTKPWRGRLRADHERPCHHDGE